MEQVGSIALQYIAPTIKDGVIKVKAMLYTDKTPGKRPWTTARLPTETVKPGETFIEAFLRGLEEEVSAKDPQDPFVGTPGEFWFPQMAPDKRDPKKLHAKTAVLVENVSGKVRTVAQRDADDPHEIHGPIVEVDIGELLTNGIHDGIEYKRLILAHAVSLSRYLDDVSEKNKAVAIRYASIRRYRKQFVTENVKAQVATFLQMA